jgi:hypothetical protein
MRKKLIAACMALAAFVAFAVMPATAPATNDPQLTTSGGALVEPGSTIKLTAIGETALVSTAGTSLVSCTTATGSGELIKNSGGTIEGEITSATAGGTGAKPASEPANECTGSFGNISVTPLNLPWCTRSTPAMATDELQGSAGKCPGGGKIKFLIVSTTIGECEYEATGPMVGDFTTSPNDAQATVRSTSAGSGVTKIRGGFFCPASAAMKGTATAEDGFGNPLYVS